MSKQAIHTGTLGEGRGIDIKIEGEERKESKVKIEVKREGEDEREEEKEEGMKREGEDDGGIRKKVKKEVKKEEKKEVKKEADEWNVSERMNGLVGEDEVLSWLLANGGVMVRMCFVAEVKDWKWRSAMLKEWMKVDDVKDEAVVMLLGKWVVYEGRMRKKVKEFDEWMLTVNNESDEWMNVLMLVREVVGKVGMKSEGGNEEEELENVEKERERRELGKREGGKLVRLEWNVTGMRRGCMLDYERERKRMNRMRRRVDMKVNEGRIVLSGGVGLLVECLRRRQEAMDVGVSLMRLIVSEYELVSDLWKKVETEMKR